MISTLPVSSDVPHYSLQVSLDGTAYALELRWNERNLGWFLSVATPEGERLVDGVRVVCGISLLGRYVDERLPRGVLLAADTTGAALDPGRDDLGGRVVLLYYDGAPPDDSASDSAAGTVA